MMCAIDRIARLRSSAQSAYVDSHRPDAGRDNVGYGPIWRKALWERCDSRRRPFRRFFKTYRKCDAVSTDQESAGMLQWSVSMCVRSG